MRNATPPLWWRGGAARAQRSVCPQLLCKTATNAGIDSFHSYCTAYWDTFEKIFKTSVWKWKRDKDESINRIALIVILHQWMVNIYWNSYLVCAYIMHCKKEAYIILHHVILCDIVLIWTCIIEIFMYCMHVIHLHKCFYIIEQYFILLPTYE